MSSASRFCLARMYSVPQVVELLKAQGLDDVLVVVEIVPDVDVPKLKEIGISGIFLTSSPMQDIIDFIDRTPGRGWKK